MIEHTCGLEDQNHQPRRYVAGVKGKDWWCEKPCSEFMRGENACECTIRIDEIKAACKARQNLVL